jgi:membrane-bound inhibitor of C-type lysozyme
MGARQLTAGVVLLLAAACASPLEPAFLFECPGLGDVVVRYRDDEAVIALSGRRLVLPRALAASGARYERGSTQFWEKGGTATFDLDGRHYEACKHNPARDPT